MNQNDLMAKQMQASAKSTNTAAKKRRYSGKRYSEDAERIRNRFGKAMSDWRTGRSMNQECLGKKLKSRMIAKYKNADFPEDLQKFISNIEHGHRLGKVSKELVTEISELCEISDELRDLYIEYTNPCSLEEMNHKEEPRISVTCADSTDLLTEYTEDQFDNFQGKYYCYFHKTYLPEEKKKIQNPDTSIVSGILKIHRCAGGSHCEAVFEIRENNQTLKQYKGQMVISKHYHSFYIFLIGAKRIHHEICTIIARLPLLTTNPNSGNLALVMTTSAGPEKRPTVHRMLISRQELNLDTLRVVLPMLRLNTDRITISESQLEALVQRYHAQHTNPVRISDHENIAIDTELLSYEDFMKCVDMIKHTGECYYTIAESQITADTHFLPDKKQRHYLISLLRDISNAEFYNKLGKKGEDIFRDLIRADNYSSDQAADDETN